MRKWFSWGGMLIVLLLFQTQVGQFLEIRSIKPDFFLLSVLLIAMKKGYATATILGLMLGLVQDMFSGGVLGFNLLTKGLAGYSVGRLRIKLDFDNPNTQVLVTLLATLAEGLVASVLIQAFYPRKEILISLYRMVLPEAVYNSLLIPFWPLASRRFGKWVYRQRRRPDRIT